MNKKRRKLVAGNWKMNPAALLTAKEVFKRIKKFSGKLKSTDVVICPPFVYVPELAKLSGGNLSVGSQNISGEAAGAYTGEVSAGMVADLGANHTIIGHSERRAMGETDEQVSSKITMALTNGLTPIVCFGELARDDEGTHLEAIAAQLKDSLSSVTKKEAKKIVLAYEPVWAIGRKDNKAMNGKELYEMLLYIRKILLGLYGKEIAFEIPVLYGGSATFENTEDIMREGQVDGMLVGRQSLEPEGFEIMLKIVDSII